MFDPQGNLIKEIGKGVFTTVMNEIGPTMMTMMMMTMMMTMMWAIPKAKDVKLLR